MLARRCCCCCAYTATVFWVETWAGQCLLGFLCLVLALSAHVPLGRMLADGNPSVHDGGSYRFVARQSILRLDLRWAASTAFGMILLVLGSFIVVLTTTSTAITDALRSFVSLLRVLHVPADDIAMVFSMAIRFIPLMAQEICAIHDAQFSRGASFHRGGLWQRVSAWPPVFIPLFVGMFRRADKPLGCHGCPLLWRQGMAAYLVTGLSHDTRFGCRIGCRLRHFCGNSGTSLRSLPRTDACSAMGNVVAIAVLWSIASMVRRSPPGTFANVKLVKSSPPRTDAFRRPPAGSHMSGRAWYYLPVWPGARRRAQKETSYEEAFNERHHRCVRA